MANRRKFLRTAGLGSLLLLGTKGKGEQQILKPINHYQIKNHYSTNDKIRIAMIGCGIMGFNNARSAIQVPGVEIVAACDLYAGRLVRMKEEFGNHLFTTDDYKEVLERMDVDAVCISTTDHWHDHILIDALKAGKPAYCEKPMMHQVIEGEAMVKAEKLSGLPVQIGSQRASSLEVLKAKELYEAGAIGELMVVDIVYDRASSNGAWQYSIPTDASTETVSWDKFLGDAPKREFDKVRFFRWRNYGDYGTGVAGDLFVHLFTALHVITSSKGPEKIYATGGLRFWKDGRDAPDLSLGLFDYNNSENHPPFNVQMRVNFVDGSGGGSHVRLIGSEGVMTLGWSDLTLENVGVSTRPTFGGWDSYDTFAEAQQKEYAKWFKSEYGAEKAEMIGPKSIHFKNPEGYNSHLDHWMAFIDAIRNGTQLIEDTTFGMRAAGPSLASNLSMKSGMPIHWNPDTMKIKSR